MSDCKGRVPATRIAMCHIYTQIINHLKQWKKGLFPPLPQLSIAFLDENISSFPTIYDSFIPRDESTFLWVYIASFASCTPIAISGFPLEYSSLPLTYLIKEVQLLTDEQIFSSNNELNVTLVTSKMLLDYPSGWI